MIYEPDHVCPNPKCGREFESPLLLNDLSKTPAEHYYACPYCMIKVDNAHADDQENSKSISRIEDSMQKTRKSLEETQPNECGHFFGYLKNRPKDTPFPDECLTCVKMLQCLFQK